MIEEYTTFDVALDDENDVSRALNEYDRGLFSQRLQMFTGEEGGLITEWCPLCEEEVYIPRDKISTCPTMGCGYSIRPCCECSVATECGWDPNGSCNRFPDYRYKQYDNFGEVQ